MQLLSRRNRKAGVRLVYMASLIPVGTAAANEVPEIVFTESRTGKTIEQRRICVILS